MRALTSFLRRPVIAACALAFGLAGCVTENPERAYVSAQPKTSPVRNISSFSASLECMDNLFASFGVPQYVITSAGIPDQTGAVFAGTKDMLISAVARMSRRSNAFIFVDVDQTQTDLNYLTGLVGFGEDFLVPEFYIRGAITQLDQGVLSESVGGGISFPFAELGAAKDQIVSVMAVDMNIGNLFTRQILPGMSASNSIAVRRAGLAGDGGGEISKAGLFFNIDLNESEGTPAAARTLIELTAIEVLGKLTNVPYWRCLNIDQTNPAVVAEARQMYNALGSQERISFVQRVLSAEGYYDGAINGVQTAALGSAVGAYEAEKGLSADGRVDFDLYMYLMGQDVAIGRATRPDGRANLQLAATTRPEAKVDVALSSPRGNPPSYRVGEKLQTQLSLTDDGYLYCYYQDGAGNIARIYPNQFRPDPLVDGGKSLQLPGRVDQFDIVFATPGVKEQVICFASPKEVGLRLPPALKQPDLTPLPVRSIDDVEKAYRALDPTTLAVAKLPITVARQ